MSNIEQLIDLQRTADAEHARLAGLEGEERAAQWERWRKAAVAVQTAVTEAAQEAGANRAEIEAAVKRTARHQG